MISYFQIKLFFGSRYAILQRVSLHFFQVYEFKKAAKLSEGTRIHWNGKFSVYCSTVVLSMIENYMSLLLQKIDENLSFVGAIVRKENYLKMFLNIINCCTVTSCRYIHICAIQKVDSIKVYSIYQVTLYYFFNFQVQSIKRVAGYPHFQFKVSRSIRSKIGKIFSAYSEPG